MVATGEPPPNKVQVTFDALLSSGEVVADSQFRERLGWTRSALKNAVLARRVFYVEVGGVRAFPAFYCDARYDRKLVEVITELLGNLSGGSKWLFFTTPKASLARPASREYTSGAPVPRTPLRALEDGDLELVKRAAAGHAQR